MFYTGRYVSLFSDDIKSTVIISFSQKMYQESTSVNYFNDSSGMGYDLLQVTGILHRNHTGLGRQRTQSVLALPLSDT